MGWNTTFSVWCCIGFIAVEACGAGFARQFPVLGWTSVQLDLLFIEASGGGVLAQ